jgi:hypothetical protein
VDDASFSPQFLKQLKSVTGILARLKQIGSSGPLPDRYVQTNYEAMNAPNFRNYPPPQRRFPALLRRAGSRWSRRSVRPM